MAVLFLETLPKSTEASSACPSKQYPVNWFVVSSDLSSVQKPVLSIQYSLQWVTVRGFIDKEIHICNMIPSISFPIRFELPNKNAGFLIYPEETGTIVVLLQSKPIKTRTLSTKITGIVVEIVHTPHFMKHSLEMPEPIQFHTVDLFIFLNLMVAFTSHFTWSFLSLLFCEVSDYLANRKYTTHTNSIQYVATFQIDTLFSLYWHLGTSYLIYIIPTVHSLKVICWLIILSTKA